MNVYSVDEQKNIAQRNLENIYVYKGKLFKLARHEKGRNTRNFLMQNVKAFGDSSYNGENLQKSITAFNVRESWIPTVKPKTPLPPSFSNNDILTVHEQKAIAAKNITDAYDGKKYKLDEDIQKDNEELMSRLLKAKPSFSSIRNSPKIARVISEPLNLSCSGDQPEKPKITQPLSAEQKIKNAYKCKLMYCGHDYKRNDDIRKSNQILMNRLLNVKSSFESIRNDKKINEELMNSMQSDSSFRTSRSVKTSIGSFGDGHRRPDAVKTKTRWVPMVNSKTPSNAYESSHEFSRDGRVVNDRILKNNEELKNWSLNATPIVSTIRLNGRSNN